MRRALNVITYPLRLVSLPPLLCVGICPPLSPPQGNERMISAVPSCPLKRSGGSGAPYLRSKGCGHPLKPRSHSIRPIPERVRRFWCECPGVDKNAVAILLPLLPAMRMRRPALHDASHLMISHALETGEHARIEHADQSASVARLRATDHLMRLTLDSISYLAPVGFFSTASRMVAASALGEFGRFCRR